MRGVIFTSVTLILFLSPVTAQNWGESRNRSVTREITPVVWNMQTAAHFARRAGFSISPEGLDRYVQQGFDTTLDEYLYYESLDDSEMEAALAAKEYELTFFNMSGRERPSRVNLAQWWLFRMVNGQHQLAEKMVYFWHDHFATSVAKVNLVNPEHEPLVLLQNELFREYALGNFKELVHKVARDPAMLWWLDNYLNVKERPNENWARELLELFTLGIGNYSEKDIQEAARAFTGWTLDRGALSFFFWPPLHDDGQKEFLGETGLLDGDDIIDIVFDQQVTAEFLAKKLFEFFVYPSPSEEIVTKLGDVFRDSGYEIRPLLRAIFRHPEFFSERAYRAQIKSPVELVVSTYRELGISDPAILPVATRIMGQELFLPPDVGGWTSGAGWLNTTTLLNRYNFYNFVATRRQGSDVFDVDAIIASNQLGSSFEVVDYFLDTLVQHDQSRQTFFILEDYLKRDDSGMLGEFNVEDPTVVDKKVRGLIYLIMTLPVYQLN